MHIVHAITSLTRGGAETALITLINELRTQAPDITHEVWYIVDGPLRTELPAPSLAFTYNPLSLWRMITRLRVLRTEHAQVLVHSHLWSANWLLRWATWLTGTPHVATIHSPLEQRGTLRTLLDWCAPAQHVLWTGVAPALADEATHIYRPTRAARYIPNGIVAVPQHRTRCAVALGSATQPIAIGAVGRLVPSKNFDLLIDAIASIKHIPLHLYIIGNGPERERLMQLAMRANSRITFLGEVPARDYYHTFDIFVQPSAYEGMSLALLEALSTSLPIITTGFNHTHPVITHNVTGLVIPPNDVNALIIAITELCNNPAKRATLAHAGHELYTARYTAAHMASKYLDCYAKL